MPNIGYAMRGYNILRGNPLSTGLDADPGFSNPIFKATYSGGVTSDLRYQVPDGVSVYDKSICNINFESKHYANEKVYQRDLKNVVDVDFKGWGASFLASSQYKDISHKMVNQSHLFVKSESTCGVYEVVLDPYKPPQMDEGFVAAAKSLEDIGNGEAYLNFVQVYGTHLLYKTNMGAKYAEQTEMTKEDKEDLEREDIDINVAASYSVQFHLGIKTPTKVTKKAIERFDKAALSHQVIAYGSRPPTNGDPLAWTNSTFKEPLPISYSLYPIDKLFTKAYLGRYGVNVQLIQPHLKDYLSGYCNAQKHELGINSCSGPRGGCAGGHDCHRNAHCDDVEINQNQEYTCTCNQNYFGDGFRCSGWNIEKDIRPDITAVDRYPGTWKDRALCPNRTYAHAFALKVEPMDEHIFKDDTALNGVAIYCRSADGEITGQAQSGSGPFGSWVGLSSCPHGLINGFRFRSEVDPGAVDHVYGTNMDFHCDDGEHLNGAGINTWGVWSSWKFCPATARVCGLQTKIQDSVGAFHDDAGLTNILVICCEI